MPTIPSVYFCGHDNCSAKFTRLDRFEIHERSHTGERPFVCDFEDCNKSYISSSHLKRHQETHEKSYRCSVKGCSTVLKSKMCLKKHLDFKHGEKKTYKCTSCDAQFNKHSWLQMHMFKHTGVFPYVCSEEGCGQGFTAPSKLKRHMKRHRGYPCTKPNCEQVFPRWSDLVKHIKQTHPVVHRCYICEKPFTCASNLKRHQVVHGSERAVFACEVPKCSRFYTLKKNLVHHVKSYHGRRPFMCTKEGCSRAFQTQDLMEEHIKYHNKKKPNPKKKKIVKPTLAATLAGCVPKRTLRRRRKTPSEESPVEESQTACSDNLTTDNDASTTPAEETCCVQDKKLTQSVTSEQSCDDLLNHCNNIILTSE